MDFIEQTISADDDGIRLDRWFKRHLPDLPYVALEKLLRKGDVRLDGKKAQSSARITAGQVLSYPQLPNLLEGARPAKPAISEKDASFIKSLVLYKDENTIIINKPFGLAVQGGSKIKTSVDGLLDGLKFERAERPKLVHRLDKDTSGVLVLARSSKVAAILSKMFASKDIEKTYIALVSGCPPKARGVVDYRLEKAAFGDESYERVAVNDDGGKYAKTEYRILETLGKKFTLMELKPLTGRTHQLRVHMQALDCPIVGDEKYGGVVPEAAQIGIEDGLHLHARRVVIPAFAGGKTIDVSAPPAPHIKKSLKNLGLEIKR